MLETGNKATLSWLISKWWIRIGDWWLLCESDDDNDELTKLLTSPCQHRPLSVVHSAVAPASSNPLAGSLAYDTQSNFTEAPQPQPTVGQAPAGNAPHTVSSQELEGLMKKLEQDNKVLAELDRKRLEKEALQTQQQQQQQQSCICGHIDTVQSGNSAPLCCQNAGQGRFFLVRGTTQSIARTTHFLLKQTILRLNYNSTQLVFDKMTIFYKPGEVGASLWVPWWTQYIVTDSAWLTCKWHNVFFFLLV